MNNIDPNATKYMVKAKINADGVVDKPDVVGAIFGQTEGLLGEDLDLRDLQKSGRIGRIEVEVVSKAGKSEGIVYMSSSLDQVETVILAASLETIDRVGPCKANIKVIGIEDVRITKREKIVERAKELLGDLMDQAKGAGANLAQNIRESVQVEEITTYGKERCPAGPNVKNSEAIVIVEGRSDVLNLLRAGIKNAVAVEGTNIPKSVQDLSRERVTTAFVDGDRGGELILRELFQTSEVDYVARAPRAHEVEELSAKQLVKCLRNKVPGDQYMQMNGLSFEEKDLPEEAENDLKNEEERTHSRSRSDDEDDDDRRSRGRRSRSRRFDDDDDRNRGRRPHRNTDDPRSRFSPENADKWKKKPSEDEESDEDEIVEQTVDTIPAKRKMTEEEPDTAAEKEKFVPEERDEFVPEDSKDTSAEEPAEAEIAEEPAREESVEDKKAEEETPVESPAAEPVEETPARKIRANRRDVKKEKVLTPEQSKLKDILHDISGTRNSVLIDGDGNEIDKVEVKTLAGYLKDTESADIRTIVFDGVISQNILDISAEKGVTTLVCKRKGKITKLPADIAIWTRDDLD